jgi:hypothetical protein
MHKMLQELGKKIVREQHPDEPRLWSRLWLYRDLHDAMITKLVIHLSIDSTFSKMCGWNHLQ